jgi:hypothetical protein
MQNRDWGVGGLPATQENYNQESLTEVYWELNDWLTIG